MISVMNGQDYYAEKLKSLRESKTLTQEEVAEKLNVNRQTILRAESGTIASYDLLCRMADLYEVDILDLLRSRLPSSLQKSQNFLAAV
jgi:transcriptional regulator with XRE-family HTH domain